MNLGKLLVELREEASRIDEAIMAIERMIEEKSGGTPMSPGGDRIHGRSSHRWSRSCRETSEGEQDSPPRAEKPRGRLRPAG